ncbi:hypothetical protein DOS84_05095 [Flavobacterium aquariorum]|uniref:Tyr recombinase domain-containing protein n=1 Tax=Flavobacterium aquariorum TaxID=2217670 RepID=A0A2W7UIB6_9FLAO|nr:hypothetical protein [Flavobacterium aquariorum]PZX94927.1 hypothetical protein DOS84_05095 [Flavobacterium aquariorum]
MKALTYRYKLKARSKHLDKRISPELVLAEISGAFANNVDGIVKYKKFQYSLEVSVLPKYFGILREKRGVNNFVYDPATVKANEKYNKLLRNKIADFESDIETAATHFKNQEPTADEVKNYLLFISGREKRKPVETFAVINFLNNHITHLENLIGSNRKDEVKDTTINSYRNLVPIIKRYQEAKNIKLTFEKLNEELYREIWEVVNDIRTGKVKIESYKQNAKKSFATNTLKAYQTYFIQLCKIVKKQGISIPLDLTDTNLINATEKNKSDKTEAFLKEDDLLKIIDYVPTTEYLELAKKYILIASQTGMRLQSMQEAKDRNIQICNENENTFYFIHTVQAKTNTECYTPLFSTALKIIQKNGNAFPDFSNIALANLNINIRKVLKSVEIENSHFFSTHNLRSSFVSNLSLLRLSEKVISSVTHPGKKNTSSSLHIYDRRDMLDKAKMFVEEVNWINKIKSSKLYRFD